MDDNNVFIDERGVTRIKIVENCRENLVMCDIDVGLFIIVVEICLRQINPLKTEFDAILWKVQHRLEIINRNGSRYRIV